MISEDKKSSLVEAAPRNLWKDYLWRLASEYKGLCEIAGVKIRLADAYLEMELRYPDKESYERFVKVLPKETSRTEKNIRLSLLPNNPG